MSKADYALLQDVVMDSDFPDLDLALRRGRHVDRDDGAWYALLTDAQELLEPFYRRYGCELIHKTDGYFYLLPTGEKVSRKQLAATDMLVGQALALLYLDPAAVERGGVVTHEEVVGQLSAVLGTDTLIAAFNPGKRKSKDERIAQRNVRQRVSEAVRRLATLGFVELPDANNLRLRAALLRFAEPVRGLSEPAEALAKLVAQGEVALAPEEPGEELEEEAAAEEAAANGGEEALPVGAPDEPDEGGELDESDGALRDETAVVRRPASAEVALAAHDALRSEMDVDAVEQPAVAGETLPLDESAADDDGVQSVVTAADGGWSPGSARSEPAAEGGEAVELLADDADGGAESGGLQAEAAAERGDGLGAAGDAADGADGGGEPGERRVEVAADGGDEHALVSTPSPASAGQSSFEEPEDDGELDWANIIVPGVARDEEDES